jgi:carbon-monoxide dehydrogenase large subunit
MLNGNMTDYLVPMAVEMPDMEVGHVVSLTADSELGTKGAGAPAVIMNAINDALRPLGATPLTDMPFTSGKILRALGEI